jgi:hypothetical protein
MIHTGVWVKGRTSKMTKKMAEQVRIQNYLQNMHKKTCKNKQG